MGKFAKRKNFKLKRAAGPELNGAVHQSVVAGAAGQPQIDRRIN